MAKSTKNLPKETPEEKKKIDQAFQVLLSSQRGILSQLNFGSSSSSEMNYIEDTDVPVVSPNSSTEFDTGNEYRTYHENLKASQHSVGVGDDDFILDEITIEPCDTRGPEVVDFEGAAKNQRKRQPDRSERAVKKRRRSSGAQYCADLLPGPLELNDLDDGASTSSLLLDDLDFPSMHEDASAWERRDTNQESFDSTGGEQDAMVEEELADDSIADKYTKEASAAVADGGNSDVSAHTEDFSRRAKREMWKPRKRTVMDEKLNESESLDTSDMDCSLQIEDLEFPTRRVSRTRSSESQQKTLHVSSTESMDDSNKIMSPPSLSPSSSREGPTVEQLSKVLEKSNGSMKLIQEWDRKMGLKRSHSKTMQLSRRSREQLLAFLKKEKEVGDKQPEQTLSAVPEKQETEKPAVVEA